MSSKHPKPGGSERHPQPHNAGALHNKRDVTGSIQVRGEIETHIPPNLAKKHDAAEEKKEARDELRFRVEVTGLVFIIIYAGLTAWQAISADGQLTEARKSTQTIVDNFKVGQRAWIGLQEQSTVTVPLSTSEPVNWDLLFKNYGQSPALRVRIHTRILELIEPNRPTSHTDYSLVQQNLRNLDMTLPGMSDSIIFNGEVVHNADKPVDGDARKAIKEHAIPLIIGGKVTYFDIFERPHFYIFCRIYNAPPTLGLGGLTGCPIPDEIDEESQN
jgi:hypothetical protein